MVVFKAFEPGVEVTGDAVLSVVEAMDLYREMALDILKKSGINNPLSGMWYLQQDWLDAFKTISEKVGERTLKRIGRKIPELALWPPHVNSIETALESIDIAYHMNHRNGEIGKYGFLGSEGRSARLKCTNPYPCAFDEGIIEAATKKFSAKGDKVVVTHESSECRSNGDDFCTYHVTW